MRRTLALALPALLLVCGCAGTQKLSKKSEQKLASGDHWRAWKLAVQALDKEPGNPRARAAATAAGASIAQEWERRIRALAAVDSLRAADQVLEFSDFRADAARYATIPVSIGWPAEDGALRHMGARTHYRLGVQAQDSRRPKKAHANFEMAMRFIPGYRDAPALAQRALEKATTRVVLVPFSGGSGMGVELARAWHADLAEALAEHARYTRLVPSATAEKNLTVAQLSRLTREDAVQLGKKAGAQRVVFGTIGPIESKTRMEFYRDVVCRRVQETGPDGETVTRWIEVPIEVVARLRDVTVDLGFEVVGTKDGATLAQRHDGHSNSARVVWTSYQPEKDLDAYALVSETMRRNDPNRARKIEQRWKAVCGEATLRQVLEARVASGRRGRYDRGSLSRFAAGAAFVFLEELPPAEDLAFAALTSCAPLREDLLRLDAIDDVDLGGTAAVDGR